MILVSACYTISDLPMNMYLLMMNIYSNLTLLDNGYYVSIIYKKNASNLFNVV